MIRSAVVSHDLSISDEMEDETDESHLFTLVGQECWFLVPISFLLKVPWRAFGSLFGVCVD